MTLPSLIIMSLAISMTLGQTPPPTHQPHVKQRIVMTWVPPYGVDASLMQLNTTFGDKGMKDGLTHLALQFWTPTANGDLRRVDKYGAITDSTIATLRNWGKEHHVRVMLCVYNGMAGWDWPLARAAFAAHRETFVKALVAEARRLNLDGVDIDLEGEDSKVPNLNNDHLSFIQFVKALSKDLHAQGKDLTVDSFSYIWNAPNQGWWQSLLPLVDGLTSMGYAELGAQAGEWRAYKAQQQAAGTNAYKLLIGMPTGKSNWQGNTAREQLLWVHDNGIVGVALWDAQLKDAAWTTDDMWTMLQQIREQGAKP